MSQLRREDILTDEDFSAKKAEFWVAFKASFKQIIAYHNLN